MCEDSRAFFGLGWGLELISAHLVCKCTLTSVRARRTGPYSVQMHTIERASATHRAT
jgi:hypothetical protein